MVNNSNVFFFVLAVFGGLLGSPNLQAQQQELILREEVKVYKKPQARAEVLTTLESGDKVPVSTRDYGAWKKIKVEVNGRTVFGWLRNRDIRQSRIRTIDASLVAGSGGGSYHMRSAGGVYMHLSYVNVGGFSFADAGGKNWKAEDLKGSSSFFGFFYDYMWNERKNVRFFFSFREHDLEGQVRLPLGKDVSAKFSQKMLAFGATLKNYKSAKDNFWWGYGLEIAKLNSATGTFSLTKTEVPDDDLPFYILPHLAAGYDFSLSRNLYLLVDGKLHLILNADGTSYAADAGLSLSYAF